MEHLNHLSAHDSQYMTSLEIAEVTGKLHKDVLKAIRNMEPAWERECGRKFALTSETLNMPQGGVRMIPVFRLTKTESLYVATKFNDEARARLVTRWYELEQAARAGMADAGQVRYLLETEQEIVKRSDEIRRTQISSENADADGCFTVRDMATFLGLTVKLLNKLLVKEGVQYYNGGRYKLTADYEGSGLAQERSFHYFGLDGEKKERKYLVWTRLGVEFVKKLSIGH